MLSLFCFGFAAHFILQASGQQHAVQTQQGPSQQQTAASAFCSFPKRLRGKWMLINYEMAHMDIDTGLYVVIRDNHLLIDSHKFQNESMVVTTRIFNCRQYEDIPANRTIRILMESAFENEVGYLLCLTIMMDRRMSNGQPILALSRSNYAAPGADYLDPLLYRTAATVKSTCNIKPANALYAKYTAPGCVFPQSVQKVWNYGGPEINTISFSGNLSMVSVNGLSTQYIFECERLDKVSEYYFLTVMRTKGLRTNTGIADGIICLKIVLNPQTPTQGQVSKFNSGTLLNNAVKKIQPTDTVFMQQGTCDFVDKPVKPFPFSA